MRVRVEHRVMDHERCSTSIVLAAAAVVQATGGIDNRHGAGWSCYTDKVAFIKIFKELSVVTKRGCPQPSAGLPKQPCRLISRKKREWAIFLIHIRQEAK